MPIYLDCNATTPLNEEVSKLVKFYFDTEFGNSGSRTHEFGARAKSAIEIARQQVANVVDAQKGEIVFTSGATESNNLAILGLEEELKKRGKTHIITTRIEHKAVLEPCGEMEKRGFRVTYVNTDIKGYVNPQSVIDAISEDTGLISCMYVNNETGSLFPIEKIADYLDEIDSSIFLHTDAAQGFGKLLEPLKNKRIDFISVTAHKIHGPKGVGALVIRRRNFKKPSIKPIMFGGGQEKGLRSGTLPVALIVGFGKACEIAVEKNISWWSECKRQKQICLEAIRPLNAIINGENTLPNIINFSIPGVNSEAAIVALKNIIAFSNGSACTSSSYSPSHVLVVMGLSEDNIAGAMRMSWCPETPDIPWSEIINILEDLMR
jgi:cysteine desulfurase